MSRNIRRLINSVEQPQTFSDGAPASSLQEGGTLVSLDNGKLAVRRKHKGVVFKSTMSRDGNQVVDKNLDVGGRVKSRITVEDLVFKQGPNLEISSGAITVTHSLHEVDVQGASGNDDLDTINGGVSGQILILRAVNGARTVTIKHNEDNIFLPGASDFALDTAADVAVLLKNGADWYVIVTASI
tara:strand:- start:418 stop:972 length:555 start_codon:yes stop_codon:yes gene_type:complete